MNKAGGAVASAPFGSAMILPIPWMYINMLGHAGLRKATAVRKLPLTLLPHCLCADLSLAVRASSVRRHFAINDRCCLKTFAVP